MNIHLKLTVVALLTLFSLGSLPAHADALETAKQQGLVGERADGALGLVDESAPEDVVELVATVNAKREAEYARIAKANNLSIEQVRALAGKKTLEKTRSGHFILLNDEWQRKP